MLQTPHRLDLAVAEYIERTEPDQPQLIRSDEPKGETLLGGPMSISSSFAMGYKKDKPSKGGARKDK